MTIKIEFNRPPASPRKKAVRRVIALLALLALVFVIPASAKYVGDGDVVWSTTLDSVSTSDLVDLFYPVGSIYFSTENGNPAGRFPGTRWERWGQGRVPLGVGQDTEIGYVTSDYPSAGLKSGAEKHALTINEMPRHTHGQNTHEHAMNGTNTTGATNFLMCTPGGAAGLSTGTTWNLNASLYNQPASSLKTASVAAVNHYAGGNGPDDSTGSAGNGSPHNNMQPYITCYMWRRLSDTP